MDARVARRPVYELSICPRQVVVFMSAVALFLLLMHSLVMYAKVVLGYGRLFGMVRMFDMLGEANAPSWYGSMTLLVCALLLGVVARVKLLQGDRFRWHWLGLALLFVLLSLDEGAMLHETVQWALTTNVRQTDPAYNLINILYTSVLALLVLVVTLRFLAALPVRTRKLFVLSGVVFIGGAIAVDYVGEVIRNERAGGATLLYAVVNGIEEGMEMAGVTLFVYALLDYLRDESGRVTFGLPGPRQAPP
jgi:hypothetical protein